MAKPLRVQGIYISSKEIENVTNRLKLSRDVHYRDDITAKETAKQSVRGVPDVGDNQTDDDLISSAIECLKKIGRPLRLLQCRDI